MIDYKSIIEKYSSPCYVFDTSELKTRINYLREKLSTKYNLVYAVKANTFIIKELASLVDRFEICSPGEYVICDRLNIDPMKMVISGVNKEEKAIDGMMMKHNNILKYTVESLEQYKLLDKLATKNNLTIHLLLRLTSGNQFGITEDDLKDIIRNSKNELLIIDGIEYFSGTQKHSLKRIQKEIDLLNNLCDELKNELGYEVKEIEYGPGLPVFYYQDDEFDEDNFLSELKNILDQLGDKIVSLEIGRGIAASCGSYLTSVVDMKSNKNGNYVIMDGGIHQLVYYGQTMAMKIPYFETIPQRSGEVETYNLCGSLCTINDFLVKNINVPKLSIGDVFVFKNVGAYSITEGISLFLSRDLPKVVVYHEDGSTTLLRDVVETCEFNFPKYEEE